MSTDPLQAKTPALLAMATSVVAQLDTTTTAWPWLTQAGESAPDLSARLSVLAADLSARVNLAAALADCEPVAFLQAKPILERVERWRKLLRIRLRECDLGDAPARAAAAEIRGILKVSPLRLAGTLQMLAKAIDALEHNSPHMPPRATEGGTIAEAQQLLTELTRCDDARRKQALDASVAVASAAVAKDAMVEHLRKIRWAWRYANVLSGNKLPRLNLSAGAADVA